MISAEWRELAESYCFTWDNFCKSLFDKSLAQSVYVDGPSTDMTDAGKAAVSTATVVDIIAKS